MNEHSDVASAVLDLVFDRMKIDALWSVRQPRAFVWWPHRVSQRVWADRVRSEEGFDICKIHAETDMLKEVPPTPKTYASLALTNTAATLNRYVYDPQHMKLKLACCAYFHAENAGWQASYFTNAVAIQAAQAHAELDALAGLLGAPADETIPPKGARTNPDDMLNVLHLFKQQGSEPSTFVGEECARIEKISSCPFVIANSDGNGATVEFPFAGCVPSTAMMRVLTDVAHPKLGSGAFLLLRIPSIPGVSQNVELVNRLNIAELTNWTRSRGFGAWCKDVENVDPLNGIAYVCFIPSLAKMDRLLENEVLQMATRTRWLHEYLRVPSKGPDETPLRLRALELIRKAFNKS
jgi:hypothetical protein